MNEFQRRALDIAQSSSYLATYARQGQSIIGIEQFGYNCLVSNVAALATASNTVQILSDSDFVMTYLSGSAVTTATGAASSTNYTLQIQDQGTGKTFFNQPTLGNLVVGQAGFPFLLAAPRLISPNTNIAFTVNNITTASAATDFYFSMQGARIYYSGS